MDNDNLRQNLQKRRKAIILHAKVVLLLLSFFSLVNLFSFLYLLHDSFIPKEYYIRPAISHASLLLPGIFCFKYPKTSFFIGGLFSAIFMLQMVAYYDYLSMIFYIYVLVAVIIGYRAIIKNDKLNPLPQSSDDILDSDMF